MGTMGYPETLARNYHCSLRNYPEEGNSSFSVYLMSCEENYTGS